MTRRSSRARSSSNRTRSTLISRDALCMLSGISHRQLMLWEHEDLIAPARIAEADGNSEPLYDAAALRRARLIRTLSEDLEVNIPGIDVILHLLEQMEH